jgi:hypothetical protein
MTIFAVIVINANARPVTDHALIGKGKPDTQAADSVTLSIDGTNAYYQKTVKVDSGIGISAMYLRSLEFMAAKNYQQTYGYQEEGKLIFTTTQDLNTNAITTGSDIENTEVFSVQFAVTLDMKKQRYRYTIHNVIFFRPTENGNLRIPLYDMYVKETNGDAKWIRKDAKKVIDSFERYITNLTNELYESIEHKAAIYNSKF